MRRYLLITLLISVLLVPVTLLAGGGPVIGQSQGQAQGQFQVQGQSQDQTAVGVGIGIGIGGGAHVNTTDVNVNKVNTTDVNLVNSLQANKQGMSLVIEDTRQHVGVVAPYSGPDLTQADIAGNFHNDVWLPEEAMSMSLGTAEALEPSKGYLWGTKTTVKILKKCDEISTQIVNGVGSDLIAIVTFRGNYGTKGYECQGRVSTIAMELGGHYSTIISKDVELATKNWNVGVGSSGQVSGLHGKSAATQVGGAGGSGTNYGTAKVKARPFITILVYR